jgi:hypothetical protein
MKYLWILLGLVFLSTFAMPVEEEGEHVTYGFGAFLGALAAYGNLGWWPLILAAIANIWFIWAWILGWSYLHKTSQRYLWKVLVGSGALFTFFAALPLFALLKSKSVQIGAFVWFGTIVTMLLQVIVISIDSKRKQRANL